MRRFWIYKTDSFRKAEEFDEEYYLAMSKTERLETVQFLRDTYQKIKGLKNNKGRKGLRRVIKIIQ